MLSISVALIAVAALFGIEAFKVRERLPRFVLTGFAVAFALWGMFVQQIADAWPKLGAFVAGIFSDPTTWFILFIALFFVLRPFWSQRPSAGVGGAYDDSALRNKLDNALELLKGISAEKVTAEEMEQAVSALRETIKVNDDKSRKRLEPLQELEERFKKLASDNSNAFGRLAMLDERVEKLTEQAQQERTQLGNTLNTIFLALQAIKALEQLRRLTKTIAEEGKFLLSRVNSHLPVKGKDWEEWKERKLLFDSAMRHWMKVASDWHPKVEEWVNAVNPSILTDGRWVGLDDLFEGSNAVINYQTFAIKFERWKQFESHVQTALSIAAFGGPNAQAILKTLPGGGPTLEAVTEDQDG